MKHKLTNNKEIRFVFLAFVLIVFLVVISKLIGYYQIKKIHNISSDIYEHPLKVSNSVLNVQIEVYKINEILKEITRIESKSEIPKLIEEMHLHQHSLHKYLKVVETNILGKEGQQLCKNMSDLLAEWEVVQKEIISLVNSGKKDEAIKILQEDYLRHIAKIEKLNLKLFNYAQNKAKMFIENSNKVFNELEFVSIETFLVFLVVIFIVIYYTINRISKYVYKIEYLSRITTIIKELDKLIIMEKEPQALLEKSCKILSSNDTYANAWVIMIDEKNEVEYFTSAVETKNFIEFKNQVKNNKLPECVKDILPVEKTHNVYINSKEKCNNCPILDDYIGRAVFNIKLMYKDVVYGYLSIVVKKTFLQNKDEISLLEQYVDDISYALYNIKTRKNLLIQEGIYKELFDNTQSAIVVYKSYDNGKTFIISDLNSMAESTEKILKNDVIGKDVKEVFPGIEDFGILDVFQKVYKSGISQKFDLKEYKDERISGWRENFVYKLATNDIVAVYADKTIEKQFQENLFKVEKLYDNIINSVDNLIFAKDINFNYIACNKAFEKFMGKSKEDIIGKSDYNIFDKDIAGFFRKHDKLMFEEGKPKSNFEWVTYPDGSKVYFYTTKSPLIDLDKNVFGLVGVSVDLTKQKQTEDALELSKIRYEVAEKMGKVGTWEYDIQTQKFWGSNESKRIYGFSLDSASFTTEEVENCIPERERVHKALVDLIDKGEEYNLEFDINPKDGSGVKRISSIAKLEFDEQNNSKKVVGFIQDITDMKQKDSMLISQSRHAAMGEMISMIAHQWRQPISVIAMDANNMIVDIALDDFSAQKAQEYAKSILDQTQHLSETINDFRNYFKPDKDKTDFMVSAIIEDTYSIVRDSLFNNGIEFKSSFESTAQISAFERELMQVFINIINNSKDALVANKVSNSFISVKVYDDEKYVNAEICDNGGGIDTAVIDKIFDPYFTTKEQMSGTGLGLYMCKMIVEEHLNGVIEAHNIDNGACFTVRLLKKDNEKSYE